MAEIATGPGWSLVLGDCLDPVTGLASLADKSVDHVITDPPYEAEAHTLQRRMLYNGNRARVESAPLDFAALTGDDRDRIAQAIARVGNGWLAVFCQIEAIFPWRASLVTAGAKWRRGGVWVKGGMPQLTGDRPAQGCECIALAWSGKGKSRWNGGGRNGIWDYGHQSDGPGREHPTQKPNGLMAALIRDFTDEGELVCDPFAGSGTTGVACLRLGRRFVGWERDPKYHAIAVKRLTAAREQLRMFEGTGT
jgi:site-specific DNA-methyltransferase (adenine-specific)